MIVSKPDEQELIPTDIGSGLDLYLFLLSPDEFNGAGRFFVQIAIA
jgi:hypothetical protein